MLEVVKSVSGGMSATCLPRPYLVSVEAQVSLDLTINTVKGYNIRRAIRISRARLQAQAMRIAKSSAPGWRC